MAKLTKCLNGHFYDAERFPQCPYCAGQGGTAPLQNETVGRTVPLGNAGTPVQRSASDRRRLLLLIAAIAMAICTLVVADEGWGCYTFDSDNGFWKDEFIEYEHEKGLPLLLSAAGDGALFVCCVLLLRSKGERPSPAAAYASTAVSVAAAFYCLNLTRAYDIEHYGAYFGNGLLDLLPYILPPLLSCAAFWLYHVQNRRAQ